MSAKTDNILQEVEEIVSFVTSTQFDFWNNIYSKTGRTLDRDQFLSECQPEIDSLVRKAMFLDGWDGVSPIVLKDLSRSLRVE